MKPKSTGGEENGSMAEFLLAISLDASIPFHILESLGLSWDEKLSRARQCADIIAEHGDVILFRGKGTADAFNKLARGIALLSFAPGGVKFLRRRWRSGSANNLHGRAFDCFTCTIETDDAPRSTRKPYLVPILEPEDE